MVLSDSIAGPVGKPRVLLLGMSYATLLTSSKGTQHQKAPTLPQILSEMRNKDKGLEEIDARDLARIRSTESALDVDVYTVSLSKAANYKKTRHLSADFNGGRRFIRSFLDHFGEIQFDQITLDYFWSPCGWDREHWRDSFFSKTLVDFARQDILNRQVNKRGQIKTGVVYLPFNKQSYKECVANWPVLRDWFNMSFCRTAHELQEMALWVGTSRIDESSMGKSVK